MVRFIQVSILGLALLFSANTFSQSIKWESFSMVIFERAVKENKLVLLDLKANWCHWCHVMDDSTYSNKEVIDYINKHFIAVEADQDRNPDLAIKYKDYGWPATIVFNKDKGEIVKRAGYFSPKDFLRLLKAIVADPSPEETNRKLSEIDISHSGNVDLKAQKSALLNGLDYETGGYKFSSQRYVAYEPFEYAIKNYKVDSNLSVWLNKSMSGAMDLEDKSWGGIYQYSTNRDWKHLHFEKLLKIQTRYINMFLQYYQVTKDEKMLQAAINTEHYVDRFLKNKNGEGYFNSQDADLVQGEHAEHYFLLSDEDRMKLGVPKIDKNIYTNNNAKLVESLFLLYASTADSSYYKKAMNLLHFLRENRRLDNGSFKHGEMKTTISTLEDNLPMTKAYIVAFQVTQDSIYLKELNQLLVYIQGEFQLKNGSFQSYVGGDVLDGEPIIEENIELARTFNVVSHLLNNHDFEVTANRVGDFLFSNQILASINYPEASLLLLNEELSSAPISFSQMVFTEDETSQLLFLKAVASPSFYKLIQQFNSQSIPKDKEIYFSSFDKNVLLKCNEVFCSSPIYNASDLNY